MLWVMGNAETPRRVGPYEIVARLGEGGMAETYVALRRGPGSFEQRVCLKRPRPELERDAEGIRQFMAEAEIAARLRHTTIAQVLDFGREGDDYYLALELVDGCDLRELLAASGGTLPHPLVLYVAIELATALDFAHRGGGDGGSPIVHRDISPSNTLVSREGEVKLTDFGIARLLGARKHTQSGIVKGKVPYMAPEYARTGRLDSRSDLFSLGVLLYECLSGARPHDGATDLETLERASQARHAPLAELVQDVPSRLIEIVESLLEPDPGLRLQSASEVLEALLSLPQPARARLELGTRVTEIVRARPAQAPVQSSLRQTTAVLPDVTQPDADPAHAKAAATRQTAVSAAITVDGPRFRRGPLLALSVAASFALTVIAFAALRIPPTEQASAPSTTSVAAPDLVPAPDLAPPAAYDPVPSPIVSRSIADAGAGAAGTLLDITVMPYGSISIDGKPVGNSRRVVRVSPGEHVIETQARGQKVVKRVSVTPGERKRVLIR
jgi:eukaryotic-like serine/threonine-protein kinase